MPLTNHLTAVAAALLLASTAYAQDKAGAADKQHGSSGHGSAHSSQAQGGHGAMQSSPNAEKAPFELQFIDTMAKHHQDAIEMAQLAEKNSSRDELKKMAKKIGDDQQAEVKQLKGWKEKWYAGKGDAVNMKMPGMTESMKGMSMEKLKASKGDAFDAMFIDMMTQHHQGAIKMAESASSKLEHAEVKEMAKKVVAEQKKEIAQMEQWKKEWKLAKK